MKKCRADKYCSYAEKYSLDTVENDIQNIDMDIYGFPLLPVYVYLFNLYIAM